MDSTAARRAGRHPGHTKVTKKPSEPQKKPSEPSAVGRTFFISALQAETRLNFCKLSHQSARDEKLTAIATKHTTASESGETEQQLLQKRELNFSSKKREPRSGTTLGQSSKKTHRSQQESSKLTSACWPFAGKARSTDSANSARLQSAHALP